MVSWEQLGQGLVAASALATGAYAWWLKHQQNRAKTRAEVAESDADRTVADAQQTVYRLLNERLNTLESEVRNLRSELSDERKHSRKLELHIWRLESLMRKAGLEPPSFDAA